MSIKEEVETWVKAVGLLESKGYAPDSNAMWYTGREDSKDNLESYGLLFYTPRTMLRLTVFDDRVMLTSERRMREPGDYRIESLPRQELVKAQNQSIGELLTEALARLCVLELEAVTGGEVWHCVQGAVSKRQELKEEPCVSFFQEDT